MRANCTNAIEELAISDPKVVVVASDPGPGFMADLAARHPDRLMIEGVCEQALIGVCAGLASAGFYPFVFSLAVFGTRRCYEQLLLDFGLHELAGCVVGAGGGLNYSTLGPTHLAVDDFALISAIPRAAIFAPGDPTEAARLPKHARSHPGLSYIRLSETVNSVQGISSDISLGKGRPLSAPADILFISCGAATLAVQSATATLDARGTTAAAIHLHTVKPLDTELVCRYVAASKLVLCVEEHRMIGGLSSAVLHAISSANIPMPRYVSIGVDDTFPLGNGTYDELMAHYGISGDALADKASTLAASLDLQQSSRWR